MPTARARLTRVSLRLSPLLLGVLLHPMAQDPDVPVPLTALAGTFLIFVSFWLAAEGLGRAVLQRWSPFDEPPIGIRLAAGSCLMALIASVTGQLGMIGERMSGLFFGATALALVIGGLVPKPPSGGRRSVRDWLSGSPVERAVVLIVALAVVVSAADLTLRALLPVMRADPLYYHLVGPRYWFEKGRIEVLPGDPVVLFCSYWEDLGLWAIHLFRPTGAKGLIEYHLVSQWIHCGIGFLGAASVLDSLLARCWKVRGDARAQSLLAWRGLALLGSLSLSFVAWTAPTAKNDWGVVLWTLSSAWMLQTAARERSVRALPWAGAMAGMAFAAKFSAGAVIVGLGVWGAWIAVLSSIGVRRRIVALGGFAVPALVVAAPILTRNWRLTGNPFFPTLDVWFPSPWLTDMARSSLRIWEGHGASRWDLLLAKIPYLISGAPLFVVGLLALPICIARERGRFLRSEWGWVWAILFGSALYLVTLGTSPSGTSTGIDLLRLSAPALVPGIALSVLILQHLAGERKALAVAIQLGVLGLVAWTSGLPRIHESAAQLYRNERTLNRWIRERPPGGLAKAWLRLNARNDARGPIVVAGDEQVYYLLPLDFSVVYTDPVLEPKVKGQADPVALVDTLVSLGFRYFLDTRQRDGSYWTYPASVMAPHASRFPQSIVFSAPGQTVIDLLRLQALQSDSARSSLPD